MSKRPVIKCSGILGLHPYLAFKHHYAELLNSQSRRKPVASPQFVTTILSMCFDVKHCRYLTLEVRYLSRGLARLAVISRKLGATGFRCHRSFNIIPAIIYPPNNRSAFPIYLSSQFQLNREAAVFWLHGRLHHSPPLGAAMLWFSAFLLLYLVPFILCAEDYYKLLNIDKSASEKEIKKAYRVLSKKFHPDKNP